MAEEEKKVKTKRGTKAENAGEMKKEKVVNEQVGEEVKVTSEPSKESAPSKGAKKVKNAKGSGAAEKKETKKTPAKAKEEKVADKGRSKGASASKKTTKEEVAQPAQKKENASVATQKKSQKKENYDILEVEGYHHLKLYTYVYDNVKNAKAIVLIVHGMMEHAGRYKDFAKFLNDNGYIVIANDLRGHGHSAVDKKFGYGERDIFAESVQDEIIILEKIKDAYELPVYLFGHSYGSMLSQAIIQNTSIVEKCVLCGTANGSSGIMKSGSGLAKFLNFFKNENSGGGFIEKMCIKNYGKKFENHNWLTRDNAVFEEYCRDEFCGGTFPFSFYKSMLTNMSKMNSGVNRIGRKKIFLIAGALDPVGSKGKQIKSLNNFYLKNNVDSRMKIYDDCRHELLNELNKEEIYNDILDFYDN